MSVGTVHGTTTGKSAWVLLARVLGTDGEPVTRAGLSSITYAVNRIDGAGDWTSTGTGTLTINSVVYDTLQTGDDRWGEDPDAGFNFAATIPASCFQTGGQEHQCDVTFTEAGGSVFVQSFRSRPSKVG